MPNVRGSRDMSDFEGDLYVDDLSADEREQFELGFEFACIIDALANELNFVGHVAEGNLDRIRKTLSNFNIDYTLEPSTVEDETIWKLMVTYVDPDPEPDSDPELFANVDTFEPPKDFDPAELTDPFDEFDPTDD